MKASYHGYTFDVDSIIGRDGMEYPAQDVVLIEPDWPSFRREAAKDILAASMVQNGQDFFTKSNHPFIVKAAIDLADELIKQLKEGEK